MIYKKHRHRFKKKFNVLTSIILTLCIFISTGIPVIAADENISDNNQESVDYSYLRNASLSELLVALEGESEPSGYQTGLASISKISDNTQVMPNGSALAESSDLLGSYETLQPGETMKIDSLEDSDSKNSELEESQLDDLPSEDSADTDPEVYTVTYQMGDFDTKTEEVIAGEKPTKVPATYQKSYTFVGWYDKNGQIVDPSTIIITQNTTFYAEYTRHLYDLLDTKSHRVYISGYTNGMFKPNGNITRAEVAVIFYSLLLDYDWALISFPDVSSDAWYANAVGTLAAMGIVSGYEDGNFRPSANITRAEFVTMAVKFDEVTAYVSSFSDVKNDHWAYVNIATAAQKGWVSGYSDKTFKPGNNISRAETVTIINGMLGRQTGDAVAHDSEVKSFYDVYSNHWAYGQIIEASVVHTHSFNDSGTEIWTSYETEPAWTTGIWVTDGSTKYYVDPKTRKFAQGDITIDGINYYFDETTRTLYSGFRTVDGWKRYYIEGLIQEDISDLGLVSAPYYIKVYKWANFLIIYAKDGDNGYTIPVKAMICSCGNATPTGTFYTPNKYRWLRMVGYTWAQWCTQISGDILFHSVPNWTKSNLDLEVDEYNLLGTTRSMGCIRLTCADAKWIYDNCALGTQVYIFNTETSGPLSKPTSLQLPSWHTWDPTDPTAYYKCQQYGCH